MVLVAVSILGLHQTALAQPAEQGAQKAILITGASSGIGRNAAETLPKRWRPTAISFTRGRASKPTWMR